MFKNELDTAIRLAVEAGAAVREYYAAEIIAEDKIGVDNRSEPVTEADREASRIIVTGLAEAFPNDALLSEEEADQLDLRLSSERVWMIDPIDGTAGFIRKDGDFAVQIGLSVLGSAAIGVVYLPARDILYFASKGEGSFRRSAGTPVERLSVSDKTDVKEMDIAVSRDHRSPKMSKIIEGLGLRREIGRGSVGVKIGMIADQTCDIYIHLSHRTKFWDTCAPQVILEEAGGRLTDLFGNEFRYDLGNVSNLNGIVASNGTAHQLTLERLDPILAELGRIQLSKSEATAGSL
ncbi:MAG TPA: inositol monophosphatase family protein [Pyrinomonadaceae bacterium]|nr:inositol monophosphatase family protein [Pyrinomonadaceae bacterium]